MKCEAKGYLNIKVKMRDSVELATHAFLPSEGEKFPVTLMRNPYNALRQNNVLEWTDRSYAYVLQDTRGRFASDGKFYPFFTQNNIHRE